MNRNKGDKAEFIREQNLNRNGIHSMEIKKIYFDMDGVLADFARGVQELCYLPAIDQSHKEPAQDDEMFAAIREIDHFYNKLEIVPGCKNFFDIVYAQYGDKCEILSGIPKPRRGIVTAGEDKVNWIHRLFSPDIKVNIVLREEKVNYCKGLEYVLIDDYVKNIREWIHYGGTGILFINADNTLRNLKELGIL